MPYKTIDQIFEAFKALKVLVVGDIMLDAYTYGNVDRISPEAPVPVVHVKKTENRLGGAGNVAMNVQALGAEPILVSVIGKDQPGEQVTELLQKNGISFSGLIQSSNRITTVKNRVLSGSQHLLRIDSEIDSELTEDERSSLLNQVEKGITDCDLIIFVDYDKGCLDKVSITETIHLAHGNGIPTIVDPKCQNFLDYSGVTLFKPNLKEFREGLKLPLNPLNVEELISAGRQLLKIMPCTNILVTLSEHGVFYMDEKKAGTHQAHRRAIADVSGAGDTVVCVAALTVSLGLPMSFVAEMANLSGGIVCEDQGILPINVERLKMEANQNTRLLEQLNV